MKRILTIAAIALLGLAAFTGCKKSSSGSSYSMKATVGSTSFNVTNAYATLTDTVLSITGNSGSSTTTYAAPYFSIVINNYTTAKTYTIDTTLFFPNVDATWAPDLTMTNWHYASTGSVTITSASSSSVSGTFNFVLDDGTKVTGGTFTARRF